MSAKLMFISSTPIRKNPNSKLGKNTQTLSINKNYVQCFKTE